MVLQSIGCWVQLANYNSVHRLVGFVISLIGLVIFTWGCMWYARAKGYHRLVGLLGLLTILGLVALFLLPNRCKESEEQVV
jgi:hypothetical protein